MFFQPVMMHLHNGPHLLIPFFFLAHFMPLFSIYHCVKSVQIRSFSGPYFHAFGFNTKVLKLHTQTFIFAYV